MRYMLDTDICIYAINERPPRVLQALREHHAQGLGVSAVTASELHFGVTLVTNNPREFERVPGLKLENWAV